MRRNSPFKTILIVALFGATAVGQSMLPPAVPLVTHDPYFSIWSMNDHLNDGPTRHWAGKVQRLTGLVRIDGKVFRWMGDAPRGMTALPQMSVNVTPTRTVYQFRDGDIAGGGFYSPLLPGEPEVMSRPVTYITMATESKDGAPHSVQLLFAADALLSVDTGTQEVTWSGSSILSDDRVMSLGLRAAGAAKVGRRSEDRLGIFDAGGARSTGRERVCPRELSDDMVAQFTESKALGADDMDMPRRQIAERCWPCSLILDK